MASEPRGGRDERLLRAQIYAFIKLAVPPHASKTIEQLEKLLTHEFPRAYPQHDSYIARNQRPAKRRGAGFDYGFAWRERALWITRSHLRELGIPDDLFDQSTPFSLSLARFAQKHLDDLIAGRRETSALTPDDKQFIQKTIRISPSAVTLPGIVVAGSLRAIIWIGIVRDAALITETDGRKKAAGLQRLIRPFPTPAPAAWTTNLRTAELQRRARSEPAMYSHVCERTIRNAIGASDPGEPLPSGDVDGLSGRFAIMHARPQRSDEESCRDLRSMLMDALDRADVRTDWIVLATELEYDVAFNAARDAAIAQQHRVPPILILDIEAFMQQLTPSGWSEHFEQRLAFRVIDPNDEKRLAAALLVHGRSASEGGDITRSIEELVTCAAAEFQPLAAIEPQVAQEYVLRMSRAIDEVIRKYRYAAQADTTWEIVQDNERWVRRVLDPYYDIFQPQRITFWLLLDNIPLELQSSTAAWHAALAEDREEFVRRLNASVRRIIFQRRMPVADALERREIAVLPETPENAELHELREQLREIGRERFAAFEKDGATNKELHDMFAPLMQRVFTRMETGWWEGAPERDRVREVEDEHRKEALLREPYIVQGRHGQGISTSLYQVIRRLHPAAFVIVIEANALVDGLSPYEMPVFSDILHLLLQERDVVVTGTCDADERTAARVVRFIAGLEERFAAAPHHVRSRFGLYAKQPVPIPGDVRVIRLGAMGAAHAQQLAAHVAATLGVQVEDGALAAFGESFTDCDEGEEIVRFFFSELPENLLTLRHAGAAGPRPPPDPWTEKAEALRANVSRQYDVLILQVIISIERLGISPAPGYLVRRYVDNFTSASELAMAREWRFKEAIHRLETEGWTGAENPKHNTERRRYTCRHAKFALGDVIEELILWLLANPKLVDDADDWRTLLGKRAAAYAAWHEKQNLLERIVDTVVPTLDPAADLILTYAKQLADSNHLARATALLGIYNGDSPRTQEVWVTIAERHLRELDDPSKLCEALTKIDDETAMQVLRRELWLLDNRFAWLIACVHGAGHLPTMERMARLLDAIKPDATPSFRERLAAHPVARDDYKAKKSGEPTT